MWAYDRQRQPLGEFGDTASVVDMTVRDENLLSAQAHFFDDVDNACYFTARIDDRRSERLITPQEGTVLGERRHRNDFIL